MSSPVSILKGAESQPLLRQIAVIGAGTIGCGVAQMAAQSGFDTMIVDVSQEVLEHARRNIEAGIRMKRLIGKDTAQTTAPMRFTTDYSHISTAGFVVENVTENWEIKRSVYLELDRVCTPQTVIAANTSVIPITRLASLMRKPERVVGIHFMNPVPLVKAVEVIRAVHTSEATLETTRSLLQSLGKEWIEVSDSPGFISNRILMLAVNEAVFALQEQVAAPEAIDRIFTECFGHKMGLLETADLIGLDTVLLSLEELYIAFLDPKFRPCPLLRQMVWSGRCGRKSGQGFFRYDTPE
jgi:3-hydroxybutyryl-CoA dehydrogenase